MKRGSMAELLQAINPSEDLPHAGYLVWWDTEGVELSAASFRKHWIDAELPTGLCVEVRARSALLKALKELERGKMIRKIIDDESQLVYTIVREDVDLVERDAKYERENRIVFDKHTKELDFQVEGTLPAQVEEAFKRYTGQYTSREVRKIVTGTVKWMGGVTVRRAGGTYFVSKRKAKQLASLAQVFGKLPGTYNKLTVLGVLDQGVYREQLLASVKDEMFGELKRAKKMNEKIIDLADRGRVRPKSVETRLEKLNELKDKASSFEGLGFDVAEFKTRLTKVVDPLKKTLRKLGIEEETT